MWTFQCESSLFTPAAAFEVRRASFLWCGPACEKIGSGLSYYLHHDLIRAVMMFSQPARRFHVLIHIYWRSGRRLGPSLHMIVTNGEQYDEIINIDDDEEEIENNVDEINENINVGTRNRS